MLGFEQGGQASGAALPEGQPGEYLRLNAVTGVPEFGPVPAAVDEVPDGGTNGSILTKDTGTAQKTAWVTRASLLAPVTSRLDTVETSMDFALASLDSAADDVATLGDNLDTLQGDLAVVTGYATEVADPYYVSADGPFAPPAQQVELAFVSGGTPVTAFLDPSDDAVGVAVKLNAAVGATVVRARTPHNDSQGQPVAGTGFVFRSTATLDFTAADPAALAVLGLGSAQLLMQASREPAVASTDDMEDRSSVPGFGEHAGQRLTRTLEGLRLADLDLGDRVAGLQEIIDPQMIVPGILYVAADEAEGTVVGRVYCVNVDQNLGVFSTQFGDEGIAVDPFGQLTVTAAWAAQPVGYRLQTDAQWADYDSGQVQASGSFSVRKIPAPV